MSTRSSARPICFACNRPFDPRSAGATLRLGPTCAKRAGAQADSDSGAQLAFALPEEPVRDSRTRPVVLGAPLRQIPVRFKRRFDLAKMAFDELFRESCLMNVLLTGDRAEAAERELWEHGPEAYPLSDPSLPWLEPEHDLTLLVDSLEHAVYHRRVFNGVVTLLKLDPVNSATARTHVETIIDYVRDLRAICAAQGAEQLLLL